MHDVLLLMGLRKLLQTKVLVRKSLVYQQEYHNMIYMTDILTLKKVLKGEVLLELYAKSTLFWPEK